MCPATFALTGEIVPSTYASSVDMPHLHTQD